MPITHAQQETLRNEADTLRTFAILGGMVPGIALVFLLMMFLMVDLSIAFFGGLGLGAIAGAFSGYAAAAAIAAGVIHRNI